MSDCIFCKIVAGELPAKVAYEDDNWFVIADIHPQAPVHLLFLTKNHYDSFAALRDSEHKLIASLIPAVQRVAAEQQVESYRLLTNVGEEAGQTVRHLHWHFLAGKVLDE